MSNKLWNIESLNGERGTGYESPDNRGPFECENCEYYRPSNSSCGQKDMMRLSERNRTEDGRVVVEAEGCCDYIERVGCDDTKSPHGFPSLKGKLDQHLQKME